MKCYIYCYTNSVTGKKYIGSTVNLRHRKSAHKYPSRSEKNRSIFHDAVLKYGHDAFIFEILEETESSVRDDRENYWIILLDTIAPKGYNLVAARFKIISSDTRDKIKATIEKNKKDPVWQANNRARLVKQNADPAIKKAASERLIRLHENPQFKKDHLERLSTLNNDPLFQEKRATIIRERFKDPLFKEALLARWKELSNDKDFIKKRSDIAKEVSNRPERKAKAAGAMRKRYEDPAYRKRQSDLARDRITERYKSDPGFAERNRQMLLERNRSPEFIAKNKEKAALRRKKKENQNSLDTNHTTRVIYS